MRRIIIGAFVSLDGVMQAPGGPKEDTDGGFAFGGWQAALWDDETGEVMGETFTKPFDLLLGRRTYDIFAGHWPRIATDPAAEGYDPGMAEIARPFNACTKYVATHHPETLGWENSQALGPDVAGALRAIKAGDGPDLMVQGSSELIHLLLANDLADELRLLIYPLVLGKGKRLFAEGSVPGTLTLTTSRVTSNGVFAATYARAGDVKTGSFELE